MSLQSEAPARRVRPTRAICAEFFTYTSVMPEWSALGNPGGHRAVGAAANRQRDSLQTYAQIFTDQAISHSCLQRSAVEQRRVVVQGVHRR